MSSSMMEQQQQQEIDKLYERADHLLFKERKFGEAEALYRRILEAEPYNV